jgi:hypothetical protein
MNNTIDAGGNLHVVTAFHHEDLIAIFESALFALKDPRMAVRIADSMDESDRRITELRDKLESVMESDLPLIFNLKIVSSNIETMDISAPPEQFEFYSVVEVAETVSGITPATYDELWNALAEAEEAGKAKPLGGDGSDGTTEEPIISNGEYDSDLVAAWPKLTETAKINIHEAAAKMADDDDE